MFEILKDQNANSTELAETYVQAKKLEEDLSTEKLEIHQKLMELQVASFNAKPDKKLLSLKTEMDALIIRLDACRFGREQLKTRIADRLKVEARGRLEVIDQELSSLSSEEKELNQKYLDSAARTAVIRESIRGQALSHDTRGNYQTSIPNLEIKLHLMDLEDGKFYSERVEYYRTKSGPQTFSDSVRGRQSDLSQERDRLEKSLQSEPLKNAEELLSKLIPPKPEPEPAVEGRKTQTFFKDYSNLAPDYEEGQELPFKGVGEVLHDRQEMT
jgi:hypothetical protein